MAGQNHQGRKGIEMKESRNIYISSCCNVQADKPACVKQHVAPKKKGGKLFGNREKKVEFSTLGHWACGQCGKACKVTVSLRPPKEETANV
jgi:hypothetical protein